MLRILFSSFCLFISLSSFSQDFEQKIIQFLNLTESEQTFEIVIDKMIEIQKEAYPYVLDDEFWVKFKEEALKDGMKNLRKLLVPIYKKHFTETEIDGLLKFYQSEIGQSFLKKMPNVMKESMDIGAEWGGQMGLDIVRKIEESDELRMVVELEECAEFKMGKFYYYLPDSTMVNVERTENKQTEYFDGTTSVFGITWENDCKFTLGFIESDAPMYENEEAQRDITCNVYEINGNIVKCICEEPETKFRMKSTLIRK